MKHIFREAEKLIFPIILVACGILAIVYYNRQIVAEEPHEIEMIYGGITLIISGVLMALIFFKVTKNNIVNVVLSVLLGIAALFFIYRLTDVIISENTHRTKRDASTAATIQRLEDLKFAQKKYAEFNGAYTEDTDKLISFLQKDIIAVPYRNGNVLEDKYFKEQQLLGERNKYIIHRDSLASMGFASEEAARAKHYEIRDTSYTSHAKKYFSDEYRAKKNLPKLNINELPFNPWSGARFKIARRYEQGYDSTKMKRPREVYIKVTDPTPHPIDKNNKVVHDTLYFGALDSPILDGNWGK